MSTPTTRRQFLRRAGALAVAPAFLARASAMPLWLPERAVESTPLLLAIFLRGGADFLNMIVPHEDETYRKVRPTIGLGEEQGVLPLGSSGFALHPSMAALQPLWERKQLAPVICTGSPHPTRSHFDAQDFMERGAPGLRHVTTGWLSRYLEATRERNPSSFRAIAVQGLLPRSLRGDYPALAVPPGMNRKQGEATLGEFEDLYGGGGGSGEMERRREGGTGAEVIDSGHTTIETLRRFHEIVEQADPAADAGYPKSAFGNRLRTIAAVVKADCGLEVAAIDYPGWDHHTNQGSTAGNQARMLADYSAAIAALAKDLGARLERTLIVTMTEFGRTVSENGNSGTDHGRGSGMLVIGGKVRGGKVHGKWKGLEPKQLADGRDLPVTTDFRDVMGCCLDRFLDFDPPREFFPEHKARNLNLFG